MNTINRAELYTKKQIERHTRDLEKTVNSFMKKADKAGITPREIYAIIDTNFLLTILKYDKLQSAYKELLTKYNKLVLSKETK